MPGAGRATPTSKRTAVAFCGPAAQPRKKLPRNWPQCGSEANPAMLRSSFPLDSCVSGVRPNKGVQPTAYSLRFASAFGSG